MGWADGYVMDTLCSPGFYRETAPSYLRYAALLGGCAVEPPAQGLELGCGIGFNVALLAAANPGCAWVGVDFNPGHIAAAAAFQREAGLTNLRYDDASFADWAGEGPGGFGVVLLHGIYSWIDAATAADVRRILGRALAVGGAAYLSYNTPPGWAAVAPLRRLFLEHARRHPGTAGERVQGGIAFAQALAAATAPGAALGAAPGAGSGPGGGYFAANPAAVARLNDLAGQDPHYLAHEYLNESWRLLDHAEVAGEMAAARLTYLGLADPTDPFPALSVPEGVRALAAASPDRVMAETVRDYAVGRAFRRDLYGRGAVALTAAEREERLMAAPLATLTYPDDLQTITRTGIGAVEADPAIARPLVARLWAEGPQPLSALARRDWPLPDLLHTVALLVLGGQIHPAASPAGPVDEAARAVARRFNAAVCAKTRRGGTMGFLAAPGIGSGIPAGVMEQVVLTAMLESPAAGVEALAAAVLPHLEALGRPILRAGQPIADPADARDELAARLRRHRDRRVPVWRALGVL